MEILLHFNKLIKQKNNCFEFYFPLVRIYYAKLLLVVTKKLLVKKQPLRLFFSLVMTKKLSLLVKHLLVTKKSYINLKKLITIHYFNLQFHYIAYLHIYFYILIVYNSNFIRK